jgi:uncharacterized protein YjiK
MKISRNFCPIDSFLLHLFITLLVSCGDGSQVPNEQQAASQSSDTTPVAFAADSADADSALRTEKKAIAPVPGGYRFPYKLFEPNDKFNMPGRLTEISGLGLSADGELLLAVNDEQGKIFYLSKTSGKVANEFKFDKSGDYEGIEMVGENIFVVKSNGTLYEVKKPGTKKQEVETHKNNLNYDYDVEGLGYDETGNRLLLACKGKAGKGGEFAKKRAIYAFDLKEKQLLKDPVFLIDRADIKDWLGKHESSLTKKLAAIFEQSLEDDAFSPSAIAVHPATQEIYILSSVGKILVVLNANGKILHIEPLDPALHRQPEGIAFDRNGTLFISNEGKGKSGKLFRFNMN